jgi:hypothetical protein
MDLRHTVRNVGPRYVANDMPVCVRGSLINDALKWIWFVTITFIILSIRYKHTYWGYSLPMEMYIQIVHAFSSQFMKKIEY